MSVRELPDPRLSLAVGGARLVGALSRALGAGGGTAAPGRVAAALDPRALDKLALRLRQGVVVVAGTNGKTTTARILAEILAADHHRVVHNRAGANMLGGIVSALVAGAERPGSSRDAVAVLETDEAAVEPVLARTAPRVVVLTNLFRDQLDRFAEIDEILRRWAAALARLPDEAVVVVNGDDAALVALTDDLRAERVLYGIEQSDCRLERLPHAAEAIRCVRCDSRLTYTDLYVGHLGRWRCAGCGRERPPLDMAAHAVELWSHDSQTMKATAVDADFHLEASLPGLFNSYNVIAAVAAAHVLGVPTPVVQRTVSEYSGAFGRGQRVVHRGRTLTVMLVKNPVGFDEVLRSIGPSATQAAAPPLLLVLNDEACDGRDVSWIWDVDLEQVAGWSVDVFCAGSRAGDLRNRLHYAGVANDRLHLLEGEVGSALDAFAGSVPDGECGFVLPTYSALLQLRAALGRDCLPSFRTG